MTHSHDPVSPNDPRRRFVGCTGLLALAASPWAAFAAAETGEGVSFADGRGRW